MGHTSNLNHLSNAGKAAISNQLSLSLEKNDVHVTFYNSLYNMIENPYFHVYTATSDVQQALKY